jgi:hypothetical protein
MDRMPDRFTSSADANAMIARTAPAVLELLGDGVVRTLVRLSVTGQVIDVDRRYSLAPAAEPDQG